MPRRNDRIQIRMSSSLSFCRGGRGGRGRHGHRGCRRTCPRPCPHPAAIQCWQWRCHVIMAVLVEVVVVAAAAVAGGGGSGRGLQNVARRPWPCCSWSWCFHSKENLRYKQHSRSNRRQVARTTHPTHRHTHTHTHTTHTHTHTPTHTHTHTHTHRHTHTHTTHTHTHTPTHPHTHTHRHTHTHTHTFTYFPEPPSASETQPETQDPAASTPCVPERGSRRPGLASERLAVAGLMACGLGPGSTSQLKLREV